MPSICLMFAFSPTRLLGGYRENEIFSIPGALGRRPVGVANGLVLLCASDVGRGDAQLCFRVGRRGLLLLLLQEIGTYVQFAILERPLGSATAQMLL